MNADTAARRAERRATGAGDAFRERLDDWCEKGILGLVLAILVFGPLAMGAVNRWQFLVIQALTLGVMVLWAARFWIAKRPQLLWPPICWAVMAFVAYAIVRYCQADIEFVARQELIRILVYAFLFFAILNNLNRQESGKIIVLTLVFLGMAISFYAAFQLVTRSGHVWTIPSRYPGRGSGTYVNPNSLAGFLEMLVPLGLAYVMIGRLSHLAKIFVGYASLAVLVGIGVTLSRGGWAATAVSLGLFSIVLLFQRHYRIQGLLMLVTFLAIGMFAVPRVAFLQRRVQRTFNEGTPDDLRLAVWQPTVKMWQDHLWCGVGPAHFDYVFPQYRPEAVQSRPVWAHNDYLNTLADWGVVGLALIFCVMVLLLWGIIKTWAPARGALDDFARKPSNRFALLVGGTMALVAILLHSVSDFNMQIPANAILVVALMALLSGQLRLATDRYWFSAKVPLKCVATFILLAGVGYLGWQEWRGGAEFYWFERAARAPFASSARIAMLERGFAAEPMNAETSYAIGECYRIKSWDGGDQYEALAGKAMDWYQRGMKLNRYDPNNWLHYGMCQDWIGKGDESVAAYRQANELDPNGFVTSAETGWHYAQVGDYAAARTWFERSIRLEWLRSINPVAYDYLAIVERRLQEDATAHK